MDVSSKKTATPNGEERRIWIIAGGGALIAVAVAVWLFPRFPAVSPTARPLRPAPAVGIARLGEGTAGDELHEQTDLLDPTPLFLPTRWNAKPRLQQAPDAAQEPGANFSAFPAKLTFAETTLGLDFPAGVKAPERPVEALDIGTASRPLLGLGRMDLAAEPLTARNGFIEISASATGEPILAEALAGVEPPAESWAPLEFVVAVNAGGLVGSPQLLASSGNDAVDAYFRSFLAGKFHLGARLRSGFFQVKIGP